MRSGRSVPRSIGIGAYCARVGLPSRLRKSPASFARSGCSVLTNTYAHVQNVYCFAIFVYTLPTARLYVQVSFWYYSFPSFCISNDLIWNGGWLSSISCVSAGDVCAHADGVPTVCAKPKRKTRADSTETRYAMITSHIRLKNGCKNATELAILHVFGSTYYPQQEISEMIKQSIVSLPDGMSKLPTATTFARAMWFLV